MLGAQKEGPSSKMATCSKKDTGETHRNRFKTMAFRVQDQTALWIILPPNLSSPTPLPLRLHEFQSFHLSGKVRWGWGRMSPHPPSILGAQHPFLAGSSSRWKFPRVPFCCSGRIKRDLYHHSHAQ